MSRWPLSGLERLRRAQAAAAGGSATARRVESKRADARVEERRHQVREARRRACAPELPAPVAAADLLLGGLARKGWHAAGMRATAEENRASEVARLAQGRAEEAEATFRRALGRSRSIERAGERWTEARARAREARAEREAEGG
ncbi:MAG: hypothetical protein WCK73_17075 [Deltaproteobacteria bacterium]